MEIRRFRSKLVFRGLVLIGNREPKSAIGMRCPDSPVLLAVITAARAHGDRGSRSWPVEREVDVAAVTTSIDLSVRGSVLHGNVSGV